MQQVQEGQNYEGSFRETGSFDKGREGAKIVTKETRGISSSFESAKSKIAKQQSLKAIKIQEFESRDWMQFQYR